MTAYVGLGAAAGPFATAADSVATADDSVATAADSAVTADFVAAAGFAASGCLVATADSVVAVVPVALHVASLMDLVLAAAKDPAAETIGQSAGRGS